MSSSTLSQASHLPPSFRLHYHLLLPILLSLYHCFTWFFCLSINKYISTLLLNMGGDNNKNKKRRKRRRKSASTPGRKIQDGGNVISEGEQGGSASKRKIASTPLFCENKSIGSDVEGFLLMDMSILVVFLAKFMKCPECSSTISCSLNLDSRMGFTHSLLIWCINCPWNTTLETSKNVTTGASGKPMKEIPEWYHLFVLWEQGTAKFLFDAELSCPNDSQEL